MRQQAIQVSLRDTSASGGFSPSDESLGYYQTPLRGKSFPTTSTDRPRL
jgi:hypothetical protein